MELELLNNRALMEGIRNRLYLVSCFPAKIPCHKGPLGNCFETPVSLTCVLAAHMAQFFLLLLLLKCLKEYCQSYV
jgi:hypothetical protein